MGRKNTRGVSNKVEYAAKQIKALDDIDVQNPSSLIKYRQNITVPAQWVPVQYIRAENIGMIPAQKIEGLDRYISDAVNKIDGGNLDD